MRFSDFNGVGGSRYLALGAVAGDGLALPIIAASVLAGADWGKVLGTIAAVIIAVGYIAKFFVIRMDLKKDINGLGGSLRSYNQKQDELIEELRTRLEKLEAR